MWFYDLPFVYFFVYLLSIMYHHLSCTDRVVIMYIYLSYEMITTIMLVKHPSPHIDIILCVWWELLRSLSNSQIYNIVLLTLVSILNITAPELIHFITGSLWFLTIVTHFSLSPHPPPKQSSICSLFLWVWFFLDFTCKRIYIVSVFLFLAYFT